MMAKIKWLGTVARGITIQSQFQTKNIMTSLHKTNAYLYFDITRYREKVPSAEGPD
jgi:hypothetical protein